MNSKEVCYVFYYDNGSKRKYYASDIDTTPFVHMAKKFTMFKEGMKKAKKMLKKGYELGYIKITTEYEFREVK